MPRNEIGRFPQVNETFKVVVGEKKTEMRTATPDIFQDSAFVYASKNSGATWWPIPTNIGELNSTLIRYYLTGTAEKDKYERESFSFPFFMLERIL